MKTIRILEADREHQKSFGEYLKTQGAVPLVDSHMVDNVPLTFTVPDNFPTEHFHGVQEVRQGPSADEIKTRYAAEIAWLEKYEGTFEFYHDMRKLWKTRGNLSVNQWASISRAVARDSKASTAVDPANFSIAPGVVVVTSKFFAAQAAREFGVAKAHYAFEILEVKRETEKAYQLRVRMSAVRTAHCSVCGTLLVNPVSVKNGIGPICAERYGISYTDSSLDELQAKLTSIEIVTWMPKRSIREKRYPDGRIELIKPAKESEESVSV